MKKIVVRTFLFATLVFALFLKSGSAQSQDRDGEAALADSFEIYMDAVEDQNIPAVDRADLLEILSDINDRIQARSHADASGG